MSLSLGVVLHGHFPVGTMSIYPHGAYPALVYLCPSVILPGAAPSATCAPWEPIVVTVPPLHSFTGICP